MTSILRTNLATALAIAIDARQKKEKKMGYTGNSVLVAGFIDVLNALKRGEHVEVRD